MSMDYIYHDGDAWTSMADFMPNPVTIIAILYLLWRKGGDWAAVFAPA